MLAHPRRKYDVLQDKRLVRGISGHVWRGMSQLVDRFRVRWDLVERDWTCNRG